MSANRPDDVRRIIRELFDYIASKPDDGFGWRMDYGVEEEDVD